MRRRLRDVLLLLMLTSGAVLLHGYHVGVQDQAIYLPAIKKLLNPALYPHDSEFFLSQTRWMLFDEAIAWLARITGSLEWVLLVGQLVTVFLVLLGCLRLARLCFDDVPAHWAAVATVAAMLTLPATGTLIPLVDNYLHPRGLATAAILLAWPAALAGRWWWLLGVALAAPFHPMMALIGGFHVAVQRWEPPRQAISLAVLPLLILVVPMAASDEAWRGVLETRRHFFPLRWTWYEWIGVIVPLGFLWWMGKRHRQPAPVRAHVSSRLLFSTVAGVTAAIVVSTVPGLEQFIPTQPMRVLHLVYIVFFLFLGGWLGQRVLRGNFIRWVAAFILLGGVMFYVQLRTFDGSGHIDYPGAAPRNAWVQAFAWARENTPPDAKFALPFDFMRRPGEDYYGFRAWAERSRTVDDVKDHAVAALSTKLADRWLEEAGEAAATWRALTPERLRHSADKTQVRWVILERPGIAGLSCPYANEGVMICRIPEAVEEIPGPQP